MHAHFIPCQYSVALNRQGQHHPFRSHRPIAHVCILALAALALRELSPTPQQPCR